MLINPRSGGWWSSQAIQKAFDDHWDTAELDLSYQFSRSVEDGKTKARRAVEEGVDTILVVGGDGMVNTIGGVLVGTHTALGVIPVGSGNGFARHFGIPLDPEEAVKELRTAGRRRIDIGLANGRPFFVTCSLAWDAALVRSFEKFPMRGSLPYVLAAAYEFLGYVPQPVRVRLDGEDLAWADPLVFTVANLTQYGVGAKIAPRAEPDDGWLELVVVSRQDAPRVLAGLPRLFDGSFDGLPGVETRRFKRMLVERARPAPIQMDGELIEPADKVDIEVVHKALRVLVPGGSSDGGAD
ncbi:MAG TPA: diacylglycerol kinase family lipid kinase [Kiritimatiellia bacterium]|nr:diacylglycerol kinase family lipid kinase [Kiritimatiellia bacterium]HSA17229.1 diacylglycerol kinase family lipid kinase [Kiritimatiellia bacterium]